jgi:hypothetical protein
LLHLDGSDEIRSDTIQNFNCQNKIKILLHLLKSKACTKQYKRIDERGKGAGAKFIMYISKREKYKER